MPLDLDRERLSASGRHVNVEVARLGRGTVDRPALAFEVAEDHAHLRAVVLDEIGDLDRGDSLVARRRHLQ
jgi:hypothetical protein